jgi:uncharacterized membrane protein YfcA
MELTIIHYLLTVFSGFLVGFILSTIGGGGSVLAVPLLLYLVGLSSLPNRDYISHLVIGTTAFAVGINSYFNAISHWKNGNIKIKEGIVFTIPGLIGSFMGSLIGLKIRGEYLLIAFASSMIILGLIMWFRDSNKVNNNYNLKLLSLTGFSVGLFSGILGIGGGFIIVPSLIYAGGFCVKKAIGTSLIAVGSFGVVTGLTYFYYGEIDPFLALAFIVGGVPAGLLGSKLVSVLPKTTLRRILSVVVVTVGLYIINTLI